MGGCMRGADIRTGTYNRRGGGYKRIFWLDGCLSGKM